MSDIHFNDPNFDPKKFEPIKPPPMTGEQRETHERVVADGLKKLNLKKQEHESDVAKLYARLLSSIRVVRLHLEMLDREVRTSGLEHNRELLGQEITLRLLEQFGGWDKDELLYALTTVLAKGLVSEIAGLNIKL